MVEVGVVIGAAIGALVVLVVLYKVFGSEYKSNRKTLDDVSDGASEVYLPEMPGDGMDTGEGKSGHRSVLERRKRQAAIMQRDKDRAEYLEAIRRPVRL